MKPISSCKTDNVLVNRHSIYFYSMVVMIFVVSVCCANSLRAEPLIPLTVKKGRNLISITRQFCTSEYHWKEVAKINGLKEPYRIYPGDTLRVPLSLLKIEKLSAKVASVFGGVYVVRNGKKLKQVAKGDFILPGQTLVTEEDGFTHLVFPDHKYTRIASGTKFTLTYLVRLTDKSLKAEFFLEKGRITHSVKKQLRENETFSTRTPVSVTGVRGTEFRLKMTEDNINVVESLAGTVGVNGAGQVVALKKGEGTKVEEGKGPHKPRKLPAIPTAPVVSTIYKSLPVTIVAPKVQDAQELRLRICTDLKGETTVLEKLAKPAENFLLLALPDGNYFGFLTSIDAENFESPPAEPFSFQVRTIPGPPVFSSSLEGKTIFENVVEISWLQSEEAKDYHFQLARDRDFEQVVVEETLQEPKCTTPELEPGNYFFRVQAVAADGFESNFSLVDSWKVQTRPTLGAIESTGGEGVTLRWEAMSGEITYDVQIGKKKNFSSLVIDERELKDSQITLSKTLDPGNYYVRIRGVLSDGQESPWSPAQVLEIEPKPFGIVDAAVLLFFAAAAIAI